MWNGNHREINEKCGETKKQKKKFKDEIRVCDFHDQFVPNQSNLYDQFVPNEKLDLMKIELLAKCYMELKFHVNFFFFFKFFAYNSIF